MKAINLLLKYLEAQQVTHVFGMPGGALEPLYEALNEFSFIKPVLVKNEQGASFMADGYARVSRKIGVCCATTGPGSTNLITGIASAYADSIPVLVITAQVPTKNFGKGALQESTDNGVNIVDMFKPITKFSCMIMHPDHVEEAVKKALRVALSGRKGPVHLNIPRDVMLSEVTTTNITSFDSFIPATKFFDRYNTRKAATMLIKSEKPAVLLGNGTLLSGACDGIVALAELLSLPVCTTPKAKGAFPENHPLFLGVFGLAGSYLSESYLLKRGKMLDEDETDVDIEKNKRKNVDTLLTVGTSFGEWGTHAWDSKLIPDNGIIQVDIDSCEFGKNYPFKIDLMGDAKIIIRELIWEVIRQLESDDLTDEEKAKFDKDIEIRRESFATFKENCGRYADKEKMSDESVPIKPQRLMKDLRESFSDDAIFFIDIGNNLLWATHYLDINKPYTYFAGLGFASMGFGVAAVVGGKLAAPDKVVIAVVGDGGFLMNGMEVATAVNMGCQIIWVIENNGELGMVAHSRKLLNVKNRLSADFEPVDFVKIAEGLGAVGVKIDKPGQINKKMMDKLILQGKSIVLDVKIDSEEVPPLESRIKALSESI